MPSNKSNDAIDNDGVAKPQQVKIHSDKFLNQLQTLPTSTTDNDIMIEGIVVHENGEPGAEKPPSNDITNNQEGMLDSKAKTDVLLEEYKNEIKELTATEDDDIEEPKLRAEYAVWKKNAVYLYDLMISTRIPWPSLTVEWLPDLENIDGGRLKRHKTLLGTQTSGNDKEFVRIGSIDLPEQRLPNGEKVVPDLSKYDVERGEIGGYLNSNHSKFTINQFIDHDGEVNRARYMPQNPSIVATMSSNGNAYMFDCTKHSLQPRGTPRPDIVLQHHTEEGYALSWNRYTAGVLATGAGDGTVAIWNVKNFRKPKPLLPTTVIRTLTDLVNHVEWHTYHPSILGSVSDDKKVHIHDTRLTNVTTHPALESQGGHTGAINCLAFNPSNETYFATGGSDNAIVLWDMRHMSTPLHHTIGHTDNINSIAWSPHFETVLASVSSDRRVMIWDTAQIGAEQTPEEKEQGPPELLFIHGGHTESVSDVAWNPHLPWVLASVSNDNHLHIFKPAENIVETN